MSMDTSEKPEFAIRLAAMDLLARREHSFKELVQKLSARFQEEDIFPALEKLRDGKPAIRSALSGCLCTFSTK